MKTNNKTLSTNSFANTLASDFYKLGKMKSVYIGAAIMVALILISFAVLWLNIGTAQRDVDGARANYEAVNSNPASTDEQRSAAAQDVATAESNLERALEGRHSNLFSFASLVNMELMLAIIIGIFVGKDFSNGTVRLSVARGASRLQMYFSKFIVMATLLAGYMLGSLLICGIFTAVKGYGTPEFDGLQFARLARTFALSYVALLSSGSIFLMIAFLTRSSGAALGASLGFYILIGVIVSILSVRFALVSIIGGIVGDEDALLSDPVYQALSYLPMQQLSYCISDKAMKVTEAMKLLFMPIAYTLLSSFVGIITFVKRDIK